VPSLQDLLGREASLSPADVRWLHQLVAEWQLLADLSFADLLLWLPQDEGRSFLAVAQLRPTTAPTVYQDDRVGQRVSAADRPRLRLALQEGRISREGDPVWLAGAPVREEAIPVRRDGRVIAVVGRDTNLGSARTPSRLDIAYLQSAGDLARMICEGDFPYPDGPVWEGPGPRVGDGLVRLDAEGRVSFASPNAVSAYRRLGFTGDLTGTDLAAVTRRLLSAAGAPAGAAELAGGRTPGVGGLDGAAVAIRLRALPLAAQGRHVGALLLVQDVTELRVRDRELVSKDATIREIHHRVKNNLQTVAALLRLQARRVHLPEARAALAESVRRVSSIAVVHETLSLEPGDVVGFDAVVDRLAALVGDLAGDAEGAATVRVVRDGSFGPMPAAVATPLALVLTELLQNAVEHGYPAGRTGTVSIRPARAASGVTADVLDDGVGLPADFRLAEAASLGLQIAQALVEGELGGRLELGRMPQGGTRARVTVPLEPAAGPARSGDGGRERAVADDRGGPA
jgi:two-component sensor histidine kinase